jgi:hypothetical protein
LIQCSDVAAKAAAHAYVVCIEPSPTSWVTFLGPGLIFISALIAIVGVQNARAVAKQRATLDFIEKVESTEHYRNLNATFSRLRRSEGFAHLTDPPEALKPTRAALMDYLNHYELVPSASGAISWMAASTGIGCSAPSSGTGTRPPIGSSASAGSGIRTPKSGAIVLSCTPITSGRRAPGARKPAN